jgi:2-polyprenyl-3-methyl-5-hydroxy-6-metoxy-1,4-benzoquinol methylase
MTLPDVHGPFHWRLGSVHRRGSFTIAEFTNEHAAFFLLTQAQLRKAIASGGFLREPEDGRHDMLCEAATDPYTRCGFRKVICVSALDDFLIHHLPDRYAGRVGLPIEDFKAQIRTVIDIQAGTHPASVLCEVETKFSRRRWSKIYYKEPDKDFLDMVPAEAATALSVGCGWGALEEKLTQRGARVTALPLDSVIGAMAARFGIEMIYGTLQEGLDKVTGREFDCVLVTDLLHLQREPWEVLGNCARLVKPGGMMVVQSHNFNYLPVLVRRVLGLGEMRKLRSYSEGGVTPFGLGSVAGELKARGFRVLAAKWFNGPHFDNAPPPNHFGIRKYLGKLMAEDWVLRAQREPSTRTRTRQAEQTVR